jgi:hypothetical protein
MKKHINKSIILLAGGLFLLVACGKQLDVEPRQSISFESALTSPDNIEAAINSVYGGLRQQTEYGRDKLALSDALSDIGFATGKSGRLQPENRNTQGAHFANWGSSYGLLNEINLILDAIPNITTDAASKDRWEGELKFLRALLHHDLAKIYAYDTTAVIPSQYRGSIVLALTPFKDAATAVNYKPARSSLKDVYAAIYSDLNTAIAKLGNTRGVYYGTNVAAHALFSRVALHFADWSKVITEATSAISNIGGVSASLSTPANYVAGWRATRNPESIFEVRFNIQNENLGVNVSLQTSYTTLSTLGNPALTGGFGDLVPNNFLLGQLGITTTGYPNIVRGPDVRALLYEWGSAGRGTRYIETTKFFGKSGFPNLDNVPVLRTPELYLNRAEAYYRRGQAGDEALALADLNTILTNRGLASVALTGAALLNEILRQRMLEYAFEGMRWFDLKRTGQDVIKSPANIVFNDTRILANIPQRDIDGNPNMQQNPGY